MRAVGGGMCAVAVSVCMGCFATPEDAGGEGSSTGSTGGLLPSSGLDQTTTTGETEDVSSGAGSTTTDPTGVDTSGSSSTGDEPEPAAVNYAFVTSQSRSIGSLGSMEAVDDFCQELADDAGLPGTFVAWLSDSETSAFSRLEGARGWIRSDGKPVADIREDLATGAMLHPLERDETGEFVSAAVMTASTNAGEGIDPFCDDWTGDVGWARVGASTLAGFGWSSNTNRPCKDSHRFYCFGIDLEEKLEPELVEGRLAFVSQATVTGDAGLATMDQICQSEGQVVREGATFRAFVSVGSEGAIDRFDENGPQWVNARGIALQDPGQQLVSAERLAGPISFHADGGIPATVTAWTGSSSPGEGGFNCDDWTSAAGTGLRGRSNGTTGWLNLNAVPCDEAQRLLCFED